MEQYIPKSAVVAKIEARYNECLKRAKIIDAEYWNGKADAYRDMLVVLDTLEMKKVGVDVGSPEGDVCVKTIWDGDKIVSNKAQKGE